MSIVLAENIDVNDLNKWMWQYAKEMAADPRIKEMARECQEHLSDFYTVKCVFDKVYDLVVYEPDPTYINDKGKIVQDHQLRNVQNVFRERKGNCVSYAVINAALLINLGYNPCFLFVSFDGEAWEHVYVKVKSYVLDQTYSHKQDGSDTFFNRPKKGEFNKTVWNTNKKKSTV